MAISLHKVSLRADQSDSDNDTQVVVEDVAVPNSAGGPTVDEFIDLEAAEDYLPIVWTESRMITASMADIGAA